MTTLAIDPGTTESGFVVYRDRQPQPGSALSVGEVKACGIIPNSALLQEIRSVKVIGVYGWQVHDIVIEKVESFGMAVGVSTFETVFWSGRFAEAADQNAIKVHRLGRKAIKVHLCGRASAKDPNVRQALLDRYGGTDKAAKGTKAKPGPLYGVKSHIWSALAVAIAWSEFAPSERLLR